MPCNGGRRSFFFFINTYVSLRDMTQSFLVSIRTLLHKVDTRNNIFVLHCILVIFVTGLTASYLRLPFWLFIGELPGSGTKSSSLGGLFCRVPISFLPSLPSLSHSLPLSPSFPFSPSLSSWLFSSLAYSFFPLQWKWTVCLSPQCCLN